MPVRCTAGAAAYAHANPVLGLCIKPGQAQAHTSPVEKLPVSWDNQVASGSQKLALSLPPS